MSGDHPNYSIIKIGQNTEESPGDLKRLAVTQTPVRNHQLTLVWKTRKGINNMCKRLKFDQAFKWYIHKPESALENEMHKIL